MSTLTSRVGCLVSVLQFRRKNAVIRLYRKLATSMHVYHCSPQFIRGIFFKENGKGGIMDGFLSSNVLQMYCNMYLLFFIELFF